MKKSLSILVLAVALLLILSARRSSVSSLPVPTAAVQSPPITNSSGAVLSQFASPNSAIALPNQLKSRPVALRSLATMTSVLAEFGGANRTMDDLVRYLEQSDTRPSVARTSNSAIGERDLIRTRSPLSGTRYFLALYTGSGGDRFINKMSFDYEASPTAFREAVESLRQAFQVSQPPTVQDDNQIVFDLGNGYLASVERLAWEDLKYSTTNGYSKKDVGTIRVTLQINQEEE